MNVHYRIYIVRNIIKIFSYNTYFALLLLIVFFVSLAKLYFALLLLYNLY
jgi:hypothetical protein